VERCVVVIPTYNERENIAPLIGELLTLPLPLEILVVDDDSPDGTAEIVRGLAKQHPEVHLLLRTGERGRGTAGIAGFRKALEMGAEVVVEMDADFSHHPRHLPALLGRIRDCDVVLGSRFVPGGADLERGLLRRVISRLAGVYVRTLLGLQVRDATSGFRCFRREVLASLDLDGMVSTGPSLVLEVLYRLTLGGWKICETPIVFRDRSRGESKLRLRILLETLLVVWKIRFQHGQSGHGGG
jgi:dolichol-phosphate mannosyltransferase